MPVTATNPRLNGSSRNNGVRGSAQRYRGFRNEAIGSGDAGGAQDEATPAETNEGEAQNEATETPNEGDGEKKAEEEQTAPTQEVEVRPGQTVKIVGLAADAKTKKKGHPQMRLDKFWTNFEPEYEGGVTRILPVSLTETAKVGKGEKLTETNAVHSYEVAAAECIKTVKRIIRDGRALNQKYTDPHFDLEKDLKFTGALNCINGIVPETTTEDGPRDVKRVTEIFKDPQFYKDGAGYDDIVQGQLGDCWFLAGLSSITANQELLHRVCVIRDQEVGVYGFVFFRDGEWHPTIIDDKLYLKAPAFEESYDMVLSQYGVDHENKEQRYTEIFQTGSRALFYASCKDEDETWVPLLEKAIAKAHGDYMSLNGGFTGEALEDLTGGVTTEIYTKEILSKDRFWQENLGRGHIGKDFIFSCATTNMMSYEGEQGIYSGHAYAVLDTYEGYGQRLVKIRNPWGKSEWNGPWSDGSKEWTVEWVERLNHKFGDDGIFWIAYEDMLKKYRYMDRTRIFGPEWHVFQEWTRVQVPWNTRDYQQTKFTFELPEDSETVIVLSQLDNRYFTGLQGQYDFTLHFTIYKDDDDDMITRTKDRYCLERSTNIEISLEKGKYTVHFKVEARKNGQDDIETIVRNNIGSRKEKITQVATLYDLAFAKGQPPKKEEKKEEVKEVGATETAKPSDQPVVAKPTEEKPTDEKKSEGEAASSNPADAESKKPDGENAQAKSEDVKTPATTSEDQKPAAQTTQGEATTTTTTTTTTTSSTKPDEPASTPAPTPAPAGDDAKKESEEESEPEDPERDPWNAFCVVGLRVYAKVPDLKLEVVLPAEDQLLKLDRDDIAHAALAEAERKGTKQVETETAKIDK